MTTTQKMKLWDIISIVIGTLALLAVTAGIIFMVHLINSSESNRPVPTTAIHYKITQGQETWTTSDFNSWTSDIIKFTSDTGETVYITGPFKIVSYQVPLKAEK